MIDKLYDIVSIHKEDGDRVFIHATSAKNQAMGIAKNIDKSIDECWHVVILEFWPTRGHTKMIDIK